MHARLLSKVHLSVSFFPTMQLWKVNMNKEHPTLRTNCSSTWPSFCGKLLYTKSYISYLPPKKQLKESPVEFHGSFYGAVWHSRVQNKKHVWSPQEPHGLLFKTHPKTPTLQGNFNTYPFLAKKNASSSISKVQGWYGDMWSFPARATFNPNKFHPPVVQSRPMSL